MHEAAVSKRRPELPEPSRLLEIALSRWENEGGAVPEPLRAIFTAHRLTIRVQREPIGGAPVTSGTRSPPERALERRRSSVLPAR
jgi:hypothetical protein